MMRAGLGKELIRQGLIILIIAIGLVFLTLLVGCDSMSKQAIDNAVYERCVVQGTVVTIDSTVNDVHIYEMYRVKRVSDNVIFNRKAFMILYHDGDTAIFKFDKRYDYETN